jgi:MFS family permease
MAPAVAGPGDGIIERLVAADTVRWWNKPNLRRLYLLLVPFCLFIESTSGFDSSMMVILSTKFVFECFADLGQQNGMQALDYWQEFFGHPKGGQLGLLVACYNLGAISSIPLVSLVSDHLGRRKSIVLGSIIMIIGAIMQGLSQNRMSKTPLS